MITRLNKGKPEGTFLAQLGTWALYETAEGFCKVAAITPVNGKANFSFGVRDGRIDTHKGRDCTLLKQTYPELYKSVETYLKDTSAPIEPISMQAEIDPYGDLALGKKRRLTPEQHWKRGLLNMRRLDFEHAAVHRDSMWESAVRMLWAGVFGTKITEEDCQASLRWITDRQGAVDVKDLLRLEQAYYNPGSETRPSEKLEAGLNELTRNDFENMEEENGSNGTGSLGAARVHESSSEISAAPSPRPEEDPFAAFH